MDYLLIADRLAADIAAGRLRPGDRLPPQRRFARQHGIAASTATRVYTELVRRGLAVGEVGRGTFVRANAPSSSPALAEPADNRVDLDLNFPTLPNQAELLAASLAPLLAAGLADGLTDGLATALRPIGVAGTDAARAAVATLLARTGWTPDARRVLFAGNGRQAIAASVAALVPVGARLGVEALTYPLVKAIAERLGRQLVPLPTDRDGLDPDALRATHAANPLHAVYLQPTLHNPLGTTMPLARREHLAALLTELDLPVIEDSIYSFLHNDFPPLAALAPEHTVLVDSLSKRLAPGLTLGFVVPPAGIADRVVTALRSGGWAAGQFAMAAATRWITDGTVDTIQRGKRVDALARQRIRADRLAGFDVRADPRSYHAWWELPPPWRAEAFTASAARLGIAVSPATAFTVRANHAPNAVRLALGAPPVDVLASALDTLAELARSTPDEGAID